MPALKLMVNARKEQRAETADPAVKAQLEAQIAADLTSISRMDGNDRESSLKLVRMLLKRSDPLLNSERLNEAQGIAQRFASRSGYTDDESVRLLFDTQLKRGDLEGAEKTLKKGLSKKPKSALLQEASRQLEIQKTLEGEAENS